MKGRDLRWPLIRKSQDYKIKSNEITLKPARHPLRERKRKRGEEAEISRRS